MIADRLGVCIVGCGMMGAIHAAAWQALPQARVVAVADPLEARAAALAEKMGLTEWHGDYRAAIAMPGVDVVSVCLPTDQHAAVTLLALELGRHVLCEKPMARTLEQAQAMTRLAADRQLKLGLGFMRRHSPIFPVLRDFLAGSGPALYHASDVRQVRPKLAMHDLDQNGGPALDMAVHLFDLWNGLYGAAPQQVLAHGLTLAAGQPSLSGIARLAPDTAAIQAAYPDGSLGSFVVCWGLPPGVNPPTPADQIYTRRGLLEVTWGWDVQRLRWMQAGGEWQTLAESRDDMYRRQVAAMAAWILDGAPFPTTGLEGEVALAAGLQALAQISIT